MARKRPYTTAQARTLLEDVLRSTGYGWQSEWRFAPPRRWRYDYFCPDLGLAVELEGLGKTGHQSITHFLRDLEKYRESAILRHGLLRFTWEEVWHGVAERAIKRWISRRHQ